MPKVLKKSLLVTLDFPPNLGGVATFYYNVCRNLPADKIVVLAPKQAGDEETAADNRSPHLQEAQEASKRLDCLGVRPRGRDRVFSLELLLPPLQPTA